MAVIDDPKMKQFVESDISNSFDVSIDTIAEEVKHTNSRFNHWLNNDTADIKRVLNIVKDKGVSPSFFAGYEISEGYNSKWGWLNHTSQQGDYFQDAESVSQWLIDESNSEGSPAWIDAGNPVDFVPENVKQEGNQHYNNLDQGTIGKAIIAGTAAATWAVYYPKGLKKEYNKIQNYADPLTVIYELIEQWGGNLSHKPGNGSEPDPPPGNGGGNDGNIGDILQNLVTTIQDLLVINIYDFGNSRTSSNGYFRIDETFPNMKKIRPNANFTKAIEDIIGDLIDGGNDGENGGSEPDPPEQEKTYPAKLENSVITSSYGPRDTDVPGASTFHSGLDIGSYGGENVDIYNITKGDVIEIGTGDVRGNYVIIDNNGDDKYIVYQHLVNQPNYTKGDTVETGETIGKMGTSGISGGVHLHLVISTDYPVVEPSDSAGTTIDPIDYFPKLEDFGYL